MNELSLILRDLNLSTARACTLVLATLVTVAGSSYRRPGARLLVTSDGHRTGSISGGCLEEDVLVRARQVALTGRAELLTYDTSSENDLVWGVGLGCHGVVQVLLERLPVHSAWAPVVAANLAARLPTTLAVVWRASHPTLLGTRLVTPTEPPPPTAEAGVFFDVIAPPPALFIFGAGDDAQPLARLAHTLGWHLTIADPRATFATAARFPEADAIIVASAPELVARAQPRPDALAVVMTHHYIHDVPILGELLRRPLAYVGLLGPKKRADQILTDLALPLGSAARARLHAPVGLDLGAETPAEVALSILAEMCAALAHRDARPLRERTGPIHR